MELTLPKRINLRVLHAIKVLDNSGHTISNQNIKVLTGQNALIILVCMRSIVKAGWARPLNKPGQYTLTSEGRTAVFDLVNANRSQLRPLRTF